MLLRPARLTAAIAWLFIVGSTLFVMGSVPPYANAVGGPADALTYFVGSLFFTAAAFGQLVQAQSPAMTGPAGRWPAQRGPVALWAWLPHDRGWPAAAVQFPGTLCFNVSTLVALAQNLTVRQEDRHIWRPDFYGSTLFLVASVLGILAVGGGLHRIRCSPASRIAWLNMVGSVLFMGSALASFVLPRTGELVDSPASAAGTLLGAACFLAGAVLMFPARRASRAKTSAPI